MQNAHILCKKINKKNLTGAKETLKCTNIIHINIAPLKLK